MTKKRKATINRYLVSSGLTFLTGFVFVLAEDIDSLTVASFGDGTVVGVLFAATRAGIKALLDLYLMKTK